MDDESLKKIESFLAGQIAGHSEDAEENPQWLFSTMAWLRNHKAFGTLVPTAYGGLGFSRAQLQGYVETIAAFSPTLALALGTPIICAYLIAKYGDPHQCESWLPAFCSGEKSCAFAFTEAGMQGLQFSTQAQPADDGWRLTGAKHMITGGGEADYYLTIVAMEMPADRELRPAAFLIPADRPGVTFGPLAEKMGFSGLHVRDVLFANVPLLPGDLLGRAGLGLRIATEALQLGRLCISSAALCLAQSALAEAVAGVGRPKAGGSKLADYQSVQFRLAELKISLEACRGLVRSAWNAWADASPDTALQIAIAKNYAARTALRVADAGLQLQGGQGYMKGNPQERRFRQARLFSLVEGSSETMLEIIAKRLLSQG